MEKNCSNCEYIWDDGESVDGYTLYSLPSCHKRPEVNQLKSFPFKKEQACFQQSFWTTEFADQLNHICGCEWKSEKDDWCKCGAEEENKRVLREYRMKYGNDYMKSN